MAIPNLINLTAASDLTIVGRVGLTTSTGGSSNAEVNVERVLKGSLSSNKVRIVFSTMETSSPQLEPGEIYVLFLEVLEPETSYRLVNNDANSVIPYDDEVAKEIETLIESE